jgi:hypothetical protein
MLTDAEENQISFLFDPWVGMADDDDFVERLKGMDPNDSHALKQLLVNDLGQWIEGMTGNECIASITALKRLAGLGHVDQEMIWNSYMMPFDLPDDPSKLHDYVQELLGKKLASARL